MTSSRVNLVLQQWRNGHAGGRDELIRLANESAAIATRRYLATFPTVAAWYETGDVRQLALLRLDRAFEAVEIRDAKHFHCLVAQKVRQTLLDLKRQLQGPHGLASNERRFADAENAQPFTFEATDETNDPHRLAEWLEIHAAIDSLAASHRELFDLLWYGELSQEEAAKTLGVSVRHVRRRWREARLSLWSAIPDAFDT